MGKVTGGVTVTGGMDIGDTGLSVGGNGLVVSNGGMTITGDVFVVGTFSASTIISPTTSACCGATATSDRRLKQDIVPLDDALDKINGLRGVYFHWNKTIEETSSFSDKRHVGVIAQEVQEVLPEIVQNVTKDYLGVDYAFLTPLLLEGIKELSNQTTILYDMVHAK